MDANLPPLDETTLQALIDQPENDNLEFKSKLLPNSLIAEYLVGIGNAGGGLLIMGVTDKDREQSLELHCRAWMNFRGFVAGSTIRLASGWSWNR